MTAVTLSICKLETHSWESYATILMFFYSQAELLLHLIKHDFFSKLSSGSVVVKPESESECSEKPTDADNKANGIKHLTTEVASNGAAAEPQSDAANDANVDDAAVDGVTAADDSKREESEPVVIKPPACLDWYPDGLAWQLEYSRVSIRQNSTLKKLHSFLVSESESVSGSPDHKSTVSINCME